MTIKNDIMSEEFKFAQTNHPHFSNNNTNNNNHNNLELNSDNFDKSKTIKNFFVWETLNSASFDASLLSTTSSSIRSINDVHDHNEIKKMKNIIISNDYNVNSSEDSEDGIYPSSRSRSISSPSLSLLLTRSRTQSDSLDSNDCESEELFGQ